MHFKVKSLTYGTVTLSPPSAATLALPAVVLIHADAGLTGACDGEAMATPAVVIPPPPATAAAGADTSRLVCRRKGALPPRGETDGASV